jgi:hypothetical protein
VIRGELHLRTSWCCGGDPDLRRNDDPSLAGAFKNPLNLKTPTVAVFSPGHPPPRRREMYRRSINFPLKTAIKLKINMSREYLELIIYLYKPCLPNLMRLSL